MQNSKTIKHDSEVWVMPLIHISWVMSLWISISPKIAVNKFCTSLLKLELRVWNKFLALGELSHNGWRPSRSYGIEFFWVILMLLNSVPEKVLFPLIFLAFTPSVWKAESCTVGLCFVVFCYALPYVGSFYSLVFPFSFSFCHVSLYPVAFYQVSCQWFRIVSWLLRASIF